MTATQALLIALVGYLAAECTPWLIGDYGGYYVFSKPLVSGLIVGLILGDVRTGILVGAAVQTVYLANMTIGTAFQTDITIVAYPAVALGVVSAGSTELAIAIAMALGLLGVFVVYGFMTINSFWNSLAQKQAEKGNFKGVIIHSVAGPQIVFFLLRVIPAFLILYYGAEYVARVESWLPETVANILLVASGMLPAIGLAIILTLLVHEKTDWIICIGGFMLVVYFNLGLIPISIIGIICAIIVYKMAMNKKGVTIDEPDEMEVKF